MDKLNIKSNKKLLAIVPISTILFFVLFILISRGFNKPSNFTEKIYNSSETVLEKMDNNNLLVKDIYTGNTFLIENYVNYDKVKINDQISANLYVTQNSNTGRVDYMIIADWGES